MSATEKQDLERALRQTAAELEAETVAAVALKLDLAELRRRELELERAAGELVNTAIHVRPYLDGLERTYRAGGSLVEATAVSVSLERLDGAVAGVQELLP